MQATSIFSKSDLEMIYNSLHAERNHCHAQIEAGQKWNYDTSDIQELSDEIYALILKVERRLENLSN